MSSFNSEESDATIFATLSHNRDDVADVLAGVDEAVEIRLVVET